MSALAEAAADYLRLRNRLGHQLAEYHLAAVSSPSSMMPGWRRLPSLPCWRGSTRLTSMRRARWPRTG